MQPIYLSSFSPVSRPALQLRCLGAWRAVGCEMRVMLTQGLPEGLGAHGLVAGDMRMIGPQDAGYDAAGTPRPLVLPILKRLSREAENRPIILCRTGLYPALRGPDALARWLEAAPALALTGEGVALLEGHRFSDHTPLRDQVEAIVTTPAALKRILPVLERIPMAQSMQLEDPGWSLLLAGALTRPEVGGIIADSGVLLREGDAGPQDLAGFAPYIAPLSTLGMVASVMPQTAWAECADYIDQACAKTRALRDTLRALYLAVPEPLSPVTDSARQLAREMLRLVPWAEWNYDITMLSRLFHRLHGGTALSYAQAAAFCTSGPSTGHRFSEGLFALICLLRARGTETSLTTHYGAGTDHATTLAALRCDVDGAQDPMGERLAVLGVFGADLIERHVFNPRLYDYLALACHNDDERQLLTMIRDLSERVPNAA